MEKAQPVRCLVEQRRDGGVNPLFHITENDVILNADLEGCSDALEEPGQLVDTLLLNRSHCNGEDVPGAVVAVATRMTPPCCFLWWHQSMTSTSSEWQNADAHIPNTGTSV